MRNDIKLETISAEMAAGHKKSGRSNKPEVTIAFSIAYRGKNPGTVQKVSGTLASLYLEQNLKTREAQAQSTTQFLEAELKELQERIKTWEKRSPHSKRQHEGFLPEQQEFNRHQAARLDKDIKQLENQYAGRRGSQDLFRGPVGHGEAGSSSSGSPENGSMPRPTVSGPCRSPWPTSSRSFRMTTRMSASAPGDRRTQENAGQQMAGVPLSAAKADPVPGELAEKQGKYSDQHPEVKKLKNEIARLEQTPAKG